jgi:hypothetical protein
VHYHPRRKRIRSEDRGRGTADRELGSASRWRSKQILLFEVVRAGRAHSRSCRRRLEADPSIWSRALLRALPLLSPVALRMTITMTVRSLTTLTRAETADKTTQEQS